MRDCDCKVRKAIAADVPPLLALASTVQESLSCAGSAQQIIGYTRKNTEARAAAGELYVLEATDGIIGGAFVEPGTPERFPQIAGWAVAPEDYPVWFLYGLVISPPWQGQGWGRALLDGICRQESFAPPGVLTLDCWAGNQKLRRFYSDAGFHLHGEFPEGDYQIAVFRRDIPLAEVHENCNLLPIENEYSVSGETREVWGPRSLHNRLIVTWPPSMAWMWMLWP